MYFDINIKKNLFFNVNIIFFNNFTAPLRSLATLFMIVSLFCLVIAGFFTSFYTIPILVKIANRFHIYDTPSLIKTHKRPTTFLGGVAIIISFLVPISLFLPDIIKKPSYINAYTIILTIIFLHGLCDDFFNYKAIRKLIIQLLLSGLLIFKTKFYLPIDNLFGLVSIPAYISIIITIICTSAIVNAYNLIDGADGLAGSISLIASLFYGILFYLDGNYFFSAMAITLSGGLIAFIFYNKPPAYIFMGDSGSLFIGMILATFTFVFIETPNGLLNFNVSNRIILSFSFLSIPILDMIRLFLYRIYFKTSPFKGDNNHIHHLMAKIGLTSKQTLLIIVTYQLLNIGVSFLALDKSWIGFVLVNLCMYIFIIQFLRQLKTFLNNLEKKRIKDIYTAPELESKLIVHKNS